MTIRDEKAQRVTRRSIVLKPPAKIGLSGHRPSSQPGQDQDAEHREVDPRQDHDLPKGDSKDGKN